MKENTYDINREAVGKRTGIAGLLDNLLLAAAKAGVGYLSNSVAVTADAANNLTDCISSLVTLLGFSISARDKDSIHPYGHGRMEYICGFIVSLLIIFTGVSVAKDGLTRLLHPQQVTVTVLTIAVLLVSVLCKAGMAWYVSRQNKETASPALKAVQRDDLSDTLVTAVTLCGMLLAPLSSVPIDGFLGLAVSAFILKSGISSFNENLLLLLGEGADTVTADEILEIVSAALPSSLVEDISLHDYGPKYRVVYIKLTPPSPEEDGSLSKAVTGIREKIREQLGLEATLYWDIAKA